MVKTFEDYAKQLDTERNRYTQRSNPAYDPEENYEKLSEAKMILTNIANTLKNNLKEYQRQQLETPLNNAESKILEQLQKSDFSTDNETFQTLNHLNPKNLDKDNFFGDFGEIQTKYNQMCTFKDTCTKLNELKNAKTPAEAYAIWSGTREDLKEYGGDSETAKLLEQRLDEAYTEKIKTTSPDIKALKECFIKGTEIPKGNLQNARRLCRTIGEHLKAEALSTYIDDFEKGIDIGQKLTKFSKELPVLKDRSTSLKSEDFNNKCQNAEKQINELKEALKQISDNEIKEQLSGKLFEAANELGTAQNRVQIKKYLETLQKEINGLKTNPTTEKAVFENIATLSKNIKDNINNTKDENEKTKLQELFGSTLSKLRQDFDSYRANILGKRLDKVFNGKKTEGFDAVKQEANIQGAKKELDTALTELRENLDKEYKANRSRMDALNAEKTLSEQDKEKLRTGYKQAHATENLSFYETYKQKVYNTIDTLKKNSPSLSANALEQLEYDYLSEAGMGKSARTHKIN